jgi:regulator of sirC expression with transglutaminase-like and TPR domain
MTDPTTRWRELLGGRGELPLDEAALVIAAHANPALDIRAELQRLDKLAAEVGQPTTDAVCDLLFNRCGFIGDQVSYDHPRNSLLDEVLTRRRGMPISLSVVLIEVARRCGIRLEGVGMPGHFLVRDPANPGVFIDSFAGGRRIDSKGCADIYRRVAGPGARLVPEMLRPVGTLSILGRMLANLDGSFERRHDSRSTSWVIRLRLALPSVGVDQRVELAAPRKSRLLPRSGNCSRKHGRATQRRRRVGGWTIDERTACPRSHAPSQTQLSESRGHLRR